MIAPLEEVAIAVMDAGSNGTGGVVSATVTLKLALDELPWASVATHVTGFVPTGNVDPDAGMQFGVTAPSTRSVAVAANVTTAPFGPVASAVTLDGTVGSGGVVSATVMVKLAVAVLPAASPAVQATVVVPSGKALPEGGLHAKLVTSTLSVAEAS